MPDALNPLVADSAVNLVQRIGSGELSATQVVEAHLDRIDAVNPEINAIVALRNRADIMADAAAADNAKPTGALHGLPVAVKDLQDVAGLPTRRGSKVSSARPARADGIVAERLRAAGAIIVGKTNTPEFGTGSHTFNDVYGLTRNPWNLARSAGGSSGGAAAALASRMLPIADGSDLGGSLRNPAAFNNVVGMRPSIGVVPSRPDRSTHLLRLGVEGPMGRTVADAALVMAALAGPEARDPLSRSLPAGGYAAPLPGATSARLAWAGDLGQFTCEAEVLALCESTARAIVSAGGTYAADQPDLANAMEVFRVLRGLAYRDLGSQLPAERRKLCKATVNENIDYGLSLTVDDVLRAERLRAALHAEMTRFFEHYDVLALPAAQVAPFDATWEYPTEIEGTAMVDYLDWMTAPCVITPTGCPAISIPAGFTRAGLPVGLQLVAPVGRDRELFEIASAIEAASPQFEHVPPVTYR